jgi:hypothetical protein
MLGGQQHYHYARMKFSPLRNRCAYSLREAQK